MQDMSTTGWRSVLAGSQILFVAFGALVLMPLITGMHPSVALFTAGLGTLIFHFVTQRQVPVFLASSFAFIAPILYSNQTWGLPATLGGLVAAGLVYLLLSLAVHLRGPGFIHRLLPPVVVGPVIMVIGLGLASTAVNMASGKSGDGSVQLVDYSTALTISLVSLITTLLVAVYARGLFRLVPIMAGVLVGYTLAWVLGVVDFTNVDNAGWLAVPDFTLPEFHLAAILFMIPVAIAPAIEHIGDVMAIGAVTGKDYIRKPGLQRTLMGDGLGTSAAAFFGGPPSTTYSEVTGAVMLTRNFNPLVMIWAAVFAIGLAFIEKFGAILLGIPVPVMGGILCLLFGSIAVVGINTLIRHQVDLSEARNLCIVSVTLVFGIGGMAIGNQAITLQGISLCGIVAILLNLILPGTRPDPAAPTAD
ncbi:uracil-xanthine permease family protein [Halopseudomonas xiamenensis]|uniref:uracil-xanthine permease family protein n=1 Tax=Halopseudomonas xiamenensis TaxID=157792 RepID=UPI0016288ED7|nr:uracil-xanthine permease family protein [Halopseudomonas xiamenensis]